MDESTAKETLEKLRTCIRTLKLTRTKGQSFVVPPNQPVATVVTITKGRANFSVQGGTVEWAGKKRKHS